jgi:hypothetical protein
MNKEGESMPAFRLLKVGGYSGLAFSIVWIVCSTGYLAIVGLPPEPPGLLETVELLRQPSYQLLFWLWPIALFEAIWATSLLRRPGLPRVAGWSFILGAASSILYFVLRYTGPFRPAEMIHEALIFFMILGVGSLSITLLIEAGRNATSGH